MKETIYLVMAFCVFACSPNYPDIKPGATRLVKSGEDKKAIAVYSVPAAYSSKTPWPLFIALHGPGNQASPFHDLWRGSADSLGVVLLTPEGNVPVSLGFTWTLKDSSSEMVIRNAIDEVRRQVNIDPNRIYIGGYSAGGSMAYYMALKYARIFSGVIALDADFDGRWMKLPLTRERLARWRVYIGHGDLESNLDEAMTTKETFKQTGASVRMTLYKNLVHGIPEPKGEELARALSFILGQ